MSERRTKWRIAITAVPFERNLRGRKRAIHMYAFGNGILFARYVYLRNDDNQCLLLVSLVFCSLYFSSNKCAVGVAIWLKISFFSLSLSPWLFYVCTVTQMIMLKAKLSIKKYRELHVKMAEWLRRRNWLSFSASILDIRRESREEEKNNTMTEKAQPFGINRKQEHFRWKHFLFFAWNVKYHSNKIEERKTPNQNQKRIEKERRSKVPHKNDDIVNV